MNNFQRTALERNANEYCALMARYCFLFAGVLMGLSALLFGVI